MHTFQERLAHRRERFEANIHPDYSRILHNSIHELELSGIQDKVIKVGDSLPLIELDNQKGECIHCTELLEEGPLVITFYRGFWCTFCNLDLANLNHYVPKFKELGANMMTISPELPQYSKKIIATQKLNFDILHDPGNKVAESLGLKFYLDDPVKTLYRDKFNTNLKQYHGDDEWSLPIPARFLVGQDRKVLYAESTPNYMFRPDPDDIVEILESLQ